MAKLIDADEAKCEIIAFATSCNSQILPIDAILMILNQIDTVNSVEVVHCSDCKHHNDCGTHFCDAIGMDCPDDPEFSCSYGERKDDDKNE